jgi:hypothetical protein
MLVKLTSAYITERHITSVKEEVFYSPVDRVIDNDMEETQRLWAKVGYYMSVYNGTSNDVELKEHNEEKAKKSYRLYFCF